MARVCACCKVTLHSTTGQVFIMNGAGVSSANTLQPTVAQSTTEEEDPAAAAASKEALRHRKLRRDLKLPTKGPTLLWVDNQGALASVKDPVLRAHMKHIDVHHYAVRVQVSHEEIVFGYCPTEHMMPDVLTDFKGLPRLAFECCRRGMGLKLRE
jgi:hypothetical protein